MTKQDNKLVKDKLLDWLTPSFKIKDRYEEIKRQQNRKPLNKRLKGLVFVLVILTGLTIFATTYTNREIQKLDESRLTQLDMYEVTKLAVIEDIRTYLTIKTEKDYLFAKQNMNLHSELKRDLFGSGFDPINFYGASEVYVVDVQYTFQDNKGITKYYLILNVTKGNQTKQLELLVFVQNNQIFDILTL